MASRFAISALLATLLVAQSSALPTTRQSDPSKELHLDDMMANAISQFLTTQQIKSGYHDANGGVAVDWLGETASNVSQGAVNMNLFYALDSLPAMENSEASKRSFSQAYKVFVQDVAKALNLNDTATNSKEIMQEADQTEKAACGTDMTKVMAKLLDEYKENWKTLHPDEGDPPAEAVEKMRKNVEKDPEFHGAGRNCTAAKLNGDSKFDDEFGLNFKTFSEANENIRPLVEDNQGEPDSNIAMKLTDQAKPELADGVGDQYQPFSNYYPKYDLPALGGTLKAWQEGSGGQDPQFTYNSKTVESHSRSEMAQFGLDVGGRILRFFGGEASVKGQYQKQVELAKGTEFTMTAEGIQLLDIDYGIWFDRYNMAQAAENPSDEKAQPAKDIFNKHFGNQDQPKTAAFHNKQVLVAYRPSWTLKFANYESYQQFIGGEGHVSANYLFYSGSLDAKASFENLDKNQETYEVSCKPPSNSKTAVILGYVTESYWNRS